MVPATDNMPGGSALRPGDIISHVNQVTSEVVNTDAEGRLILADALAYGIKSYEPDCVVDIATLTGAVIIGLGHHYTGMVSNSDALAQRVESAGQDAGEPVWRLPLNEDYVKQIESKVADIKNTGGNPRVPSPRPRICPNLWGTPPGSTWTSRARPGISLKNPIFPKALPASGSGPLSS